MTAPADRPIDNDLARVLDGFAVPPLGADFADRVTARALAATPAPVAPPPRRSGRGGWSRGNRVVIGLVASSLLGATAAAAAGLFGDVGITIPALKEIVERVTSPAPLEVVQPRPARRAEAPPAAVGEGPDTDRAAGTGAAPPITPEQLEARFEMADQRRAIRREVATRRIEAAVDRRIEARREAGLPVPSPEQRALVRERIENRVGARDAVVAERREAVRDTLREAVRERQLASPPSAGAEAAPPTPPAPATAAPDAAEASAPAPDDTTATPRVNRPALTPEQRAALRELRQRRLQRLRRN